MKNKQEVASLFKKQKETSIKALGQWYSYVTRARGFYDGDTMAYRDVIQFTDQRGAKKKALLQFNKVQANIETVAGFMAQNRMVAKFSARVEGQPVDNIYSRNMNALHEYHRENANAPQLETDQDVDMLICGIGAIDTDLSYMIGNSTTMPDGEIVQKKLNPKSFYWDSAARAKNLLDAGFMGYHEDFNLQDALALFQGSVEDDFAGVDDEDKGGYSYNPYGGVYTQIKASDSVEWTSEENEMVRVYNHQWFEYETFYRAANPVYTAVTPEDALYYKIKLEAAAAEYKNTSDLPKGVEVQDMFGFDPLAEILTLDAKLKAVLDKSLPSILECVPFKKKCFYTAVVSGKHVFASFKSISQQGFSIKCKTGIFNETKKHWVGMVDAMMEPTEYYNKLLTELLFTIASNSKGGVMVEKTAVEDVAKFERQYAKTDAVIVTNDGALTNGRIQPKANPAMPTGMENIINLCDQSIAQNGIDPAFMGDLQDKEQSGVLFKRRIRQCISKLGRYFDSITLYQKEHARLMADLITVWVENNQGAVVRIAGEDGIEEFMQLTRDKLASEYDVTIREAPQTPEDKQESAQVLSMYADKLMMVNPAAGQKLIAESLQMLPIDRDALSRIMEALQPKEQPQIDPAMVQAMQAQIEALTSELTKAQTAKTMSEVELNRVKTVKTLEDAKRVGLESDLLQSGNYDTPTVNI